MELKPGYKQTEIGVIPEDWEVKRLLSVCTMKSGESITSANIFKSEKYPCYGGNGLRGYTHRFTHNGNYCLIGRQGALCGNVLGVQGQFFASEHAIVVTPLKEIEVHWLTCVLECMNLNQYSESSAQPGLSVNKLLQLLILVPPTMAEQTAIANILTDADALIKSLEQLIAKKRQIKQGAMQELLRPKEKWMECCIGDLLEIMHGKSQYAVTDKNGIYPILATGGQIGVANRFLYDKPSVLIGRKGTIDRPQYMAKPFWSVDTLFYSIIHESNNPKYIFYQFCLIDWKKYNEASGVPSLNARTIKQIELKVPSLIEQTAIAEILSSMDAEITALEDKLKKFRQIKQGMVHNLLTGKIRLINPDKASVNLSKNHQQGIN
jgi:type I restriction enzyme S subunit